MKKLIILILALALVLSLSVPAFAVTPTFQPPKVPDVSKVTFRVDLSNSIRNYWASHPIKWR